MRGRTAGSPSALVAALLALAAAGCATAFRVKPNSIASGAVGGIYQPIAEAIAKIARETPGLDLPLTVEATGASVSNVQLLGDGKVQLALVQNDIAFYAHEGTTLPAFRARLARISDDRLDLSRVRPGRGVEAPGHRCRGIRASASRSGPEGRARSRTRSSSLKPTGSR
jgi:hypothetical protein